MKRYHDIAGDGGSNIVAQVTAQQEAIRTALASLGHIVAVGSGKGGVGKSTATMVLAQALRARGRRVAILDADVNGPCQAKMAGLEGAPWVPGETGLSVPRRADGLGVVSFGSVLAADAPVTFPSVARGDAYVWRATREFATLGQLVASVDWSDFDLLLVDLPPGAERSAQFAEFLGPRAAFVVVTIPTELARGVVARSITALREADARLLGYVENMAGYHHGASGDVLPLFPAATTALDIPRLGALPFDPEIACWCDGGWPAEAGPRALALPGARSLVDHVIEALEAS